MPSALGLGLGLGTLGILTTIGIALFLLESQGFFNQNDNDSINLPPQPNCGIPEIEPSFNTSIFARIIKGHDAIPNSYPWIVSLRALKVSKLHFCGGSLIYSDVVITAAHCIYNLKPEDIAVAVGLHSRNETLNDSNLFNVSTIKYNRLYTDLIKNNDIALLKLSRPIEFSSKISTICLPKLKDDIKNVFDKNVTLVGWGSTNGVNSQSSLSLNLQQTVLKVYGDQSFCKNKLPFFDVNKMYCAIDENTIQASNICYGDSGGPLMYKEDGKWTIYGLSSLVLSDAVSLKCDPYRPSFFTSTAAFIEWVATTLKEFS